MVTQQGSEVYAQIQQKAVPEVDSFEQELYPHVSDWKLFSTVQNTDRHTATPPQPPTSSFPMKCKLQWLFNMLINIQRIWG